MLAEDGEEKERRKVEGRLVFWAVNADMEIGWGQFGHKKKKSQHKVHKNHIIFRINGCISDFQFLGFENQIIPKWPTQNTSFPSLIVLSIH